MKNILHKLICVVKYVVFVFPFLKKGGLLNQIDSINWKGKRRIVLGNNNIFQKSSKLLVEHKSKFIEIGTRNVFSYNAIINAHHGYIEIGDFNFVGPNTIIQGLGGVHIGSHCMIAGNCFITSSNHDHSNPLSQDYLLSEIGKKINIGDKVWIGANCVLTAGISVGNNSIVAAGSVVTKDVGEFQMVGGVPAKLIKRFDKEIGKWKKV